MGALSDPWSAGTECRASSTSPVICFWVHLPRQGYGCGVMGPHPRPPQWWPWQRVVMDASAQGSESDPATLEQVSDQLVQIVERLTTLVDRLETPAPAELYTVSAAAKLLGVSESWVQREARADRIRHRRLGRRYRFTRSDLDELVERSLHEPSRDELALSSRSLAALRRGPGRGHRSSPRQLGPYDVAGIPLGAVPDSSRPATVRIVCPAVGHPAQALRQGVRTVDCPECRRPNCTLQRFDDRTRTGTIARHILYIPASDLLPEHVLWPGGDKGASGLSSRG